MATEQEGHTPGIVSTMPVHDGDGYSWGGDVIVTFGERSINLGTSQNWAKFQEIKALARLIAAAPDLLKAGEGARQALWNALDHLGFECPDAHPAIVELDAAIARATGEA